MGYKRASEKMKKSLFLIISMLLLAITICAKRPHLSNEVWILMERQEYKEKQPNDSILISYKTKHPYINDRLVGIILPEPIILITVHNTSERAIYVDLLNSYIIPNGEVFSLFTNSTNVSTQSSAVGGGVGIGIVGVGSAYSNSNTTVTQEQRFITIPSGTKKVIEAPIIKHVGASWTLNNGNTIIKEQKFDWTYVRIINNNIYDGLHSYDESNSPLHVDIRINYSFNSDMQPNYSNKSVYYTQYIIGLKNHVFSGNELYQEKKAEKIFPMFYEYKNKPNTLILKLWPSHINLKL